MSSNEVVIRVLNALMAERGWRQTELAMKAGIAQKTVSNILISGSTTTGKFDYLAEAFKVEPWVFLLNGISNSFEAKQLASLIRCYFESDSEGKEQIVRTANAEARYSNSRTKN